MKKNTKADFAMLIFGLIVFLLAVFSGKYQNLKNIISFEWIYVALVIIYMLLTIIKMKNNKSARLMNFLLLLMVSVVAIILYNLDKNK